jgi:peptidoglycan/xylan/chitin deacetylase (PgdA/CDA1 family)
MKTHLVQEVKVQADKITVIRNGFDVTKFTIPQIIPPTAPVISIIGRTSGFKGEKTGVILMEVMPRLLQQFPTLKLNVIGGKPEQLGEATLQQVKLLNEQFGDRIQLVGHVNNVLEWMKASSIVIGSGRVAMEACLIDVPCIALGESSYHGLITPKNKEEVMAANFGDIQPLATMPAIDFELLYSDLTHFIGSTDSIQSNKEWLAEYYGINVVGHAIEEAYRSAIFKKYHPTWIPVLMYHKVPIEPIKSKHQIYVTQSVFEKQLKSLKARGFTGITFADYDKYRTGVLPANKLPKKPIILTFDDGYEDNYRNAFPLLKKYGFKAVIYALGDNAITYNTWDVPNGEPRQALMDNVMRLEMQQWGIEFGSHTLSHADLTAVSKEQAEEEIRQSKLNLEKDLGQAVISFANPYGNTNEAIKTLIQQAGYKYAVATDTGPLHLEDDLFQIFRVAIFPNDVGARFKKKTSGWYRRYVRFKYGR